MGIPIALLVITCIGIPVAVYLGLGWSLVFQAIILEGHGTFDAMRRSSDLVSGHRWRLLACLVLIGLIVWLLISIPTGLFSFAASIVMAASGSTTVRVLTQIGNALFQAAGQTLFGAIGLVTATLLYYDLRVRKEAFDLQQRLPDDRGRAANRLPAVRPAATAVSPAAAVPTAGAGLSAVSPAAAAAVPAPGAASAASAASESMRADLRSMLLASSAPAEADAPSATPEQLEALRAILARAEFQPTERRAILDWLLDPIRSWLRWLVLELGAWLDWLFGPTTGGVSGNVIMYVVVAVGVLVLIVTAVMLVRLLRGSLAGDAAFAEANLGGPPRAADELAQARALAQAGDARRAVHHLYRAILLRLDERDHLPFDGSLTNRELLPRLTAAPALAGPFAELVARFDRLWYGQTDCTAEEYAAFARLGERVWEAAGSVAPNAVRPDPL